MAALKDVNAVHFPSQLFPVLTSVLLNNIESAHEKGFYPLMSLPACAAMGLRVVWQIGNAIRGHIKGGTLAATDKRGHSSATPGEEGGRNHKHSFPFLHEEGEGGGWQGRLRHSSPNSASVVSVLSPMLRVGSPCGQPVMSLIIYGSYSAKLTMHWMSLNAVAHVA